MDSSFLTGQPTRANWSKAVEICAHVGGALASFHDDAEEFTFPIFSKEFFFGLEHRRTAATGVYSYRWSDDSLLTYARWNQLSNFDEEKTCGKFAYFSFNEIHWRADSYSSQLPYVCKKPKSDTSSFSLYL